jgi:hypothetical protein
MATALLVVPFLVADRLNHTVQTPPAMNMRQAASASARTSFLLVTGAAGFMGRIFRPSPVLMSGSRHLAAASAA